MITKAECQRRARKARVAAFGIVDRRERLQNRITDGDPYPTWAREMDRQAGDLFSEAHRWLDLAQAPFWKRWFR